VPKVPLTTAERPHRRAAGAVTMEVSRRQRPT